MKLKNQLVNKELSIELDKLGAKEESVYWHKIPNKKCRNGSIASIVEYREESKWFDFYRAYTVAELLDILRDNVLSFELYCADKNKWTVDTRTHECECKKCKEELKKNPEYASYTWEIEEGKSPVEVLAKLLIKLLKSNLIKI